MGMASFSFPPLGKEKIQWTARPLGHAQILMYENRLIIRGRLHNLEQVVVNFICFIKKNTFNFHLNKNLMYMSIVGEIVIVIMSKIEILKC
jgi:hypothetical protein